MTIRQKQWQLYFLGCFPSDLEQRKAIDGIWGPLSEAATRNFQKTFGVAETGKFDAATEQKSQEVVDAIQDVVSRYAPVPLNTAFWGLAGKKTLDATRDYQHAMGLPETGIADAETREVILQQEGPEPQPDTGTEDKTELELLFVGIRYWSPDEFRCRCGEYHKPYCNGFPVLPDRTLLELVDDLRHNAGRPGHRSSAIRCYQHNIDSKGVSNSRHLTGKALDFFIEGMTGTQLLRAAQADPRTHYAYIIQDQWVHVDVL